MKEKLKIIELCAGIGAQLRGLKNTGLFDIEVVVTSEIDKDAIVSYAAIHHNLTNGMIDSFDMYPPIDEMRKYLTELNIGYNPEKDKPYNWYKSGAKFEREIKKTYLSCLLNNNVGDVSKIEALPYADVWFLSFPCQSISVAGKLKGMSPDSGTRSSLVWHTIRLLEEAKKTGWLPKYMLLENVKNLIGKKFLKDFQAFNEIVESFGYNIYYQVLNAKECGVPQNRERVFAVYIRKDLDTGDMTFPVPFDNGLRLKDILDDKVDENYYINTEKAQKLIQKLLGDEVIGNEDLQTKSKINIADGDRFSTRFS